MQGHRANLVKSRGVGEGWSREAAQPGNDCRNCIKKENIVVSYDKLPRALGYSFAAVPRPYTILVPVVEEIKLNKVLGRNELRALADSLKTKSAIIESLKRAR